MRFLACAGLAFAGVVAAVVDVDGVDVDELVEDELELLPQAATPSDNPAMPTLTSDFKRI